MDPETEQHIEAARRGVGKKQPRNFAGDLATEVPATRYVELRHQRARERLEHTLDRIAPVTTTTLPEGNRYRIKSRCSGCGGPIDLVSDDFTEIDRGDGDEPGVAGAPNNIARATSAGLLRQGAHRATAVKCDPCIKREEDSEAKVKLEAETRARLEMALMPKAVQGFEFNGKGGNRMIDGEGRDNAIRAAYRWATHERMENKPGVLLVGHKGAGKTRLAATAAWLRLRRWPVRWVSWPILIAELGAAFNDDARQAALKVLTGDGAIVLDDIARDDVKVSDWQRTQLFAAIDKRVQAGAPILITTNVTSSSTGGGVAAGLGERLGDSIVSRLIGYCTVQDLPGPDRRLELNFDGTEPKDERDA